MPLYRRSLMAGVGASAVIAATETAVHAQIMLRPAAPALPSTGVAIPFSLTNPAGQPTQVNPYFSFGLPLARGDFLDASQKLSVYDQTGTTRIVDCQVDQVARGWKPDGSVNQCVVSGYMTGTTLPPGTTANFTMRAITGAAPATPVCTLASLAAASDIKAICVIGTDTFTVSVNSIIAAGTAPALYPVTYIRQWKSGPVSCEWCFGAYLKRNSDGGLHRWAFLKLYITALSASGPFIVRGLFENPNSYGPTPTGTVGPSAVTLPLVIAESIDVYNGASFICALGGVNDANKGTFLPSAVNLATAELNPTFSGGLNTWPALGSGRNPIGFVSTGTLPGGIGPASTTTYWAVVDRATNQLIPVTARTYATALTDNVYSKIAIPVAGTSVAINKWIPANGGIYLSTTAGASTGRLPTGAVFADNSAGGALVWTLISPQLTSQGTGTHSVIMKAAITGGSKAPLMGPDTYPFWSGAGTLPKLLVGYDRNYIFGKTHCMLPLDPAITVAPWIGALPRYVQNVMYLPGAPGTYYIGTVSESPMDERINQGSPTAMASICLPADAGMAMSCRAMALSWVDRNSSWRDERAQEVNVVNYGPDRLGSGTYPGMPPLNPTLVFSGIAPVGSPKPIPYNTTWTGYGGFLFGSSAPDSAHTPNPPYWPAITSGDPLFMDMEIELGSFQLSQNGGGQVIRSALINGVNMTWAWPFMLQTRGAGHAFQIFTQAEWVIPDNHPAKPYFSDVMDDSANIGMLWANQKLGPNARAVGYIPFLYPSAPSNIQGQETWMMGYLHMAHMMNVLRNNRPGFRTFNETYFYKSLIPLFDSDVGGSEKLVEIQWDIIGNIVGGANASPDPPLDSQFYLNVTDRLRGNPQFFMRLAVIPPPQDLFVNESVDTGGTDYVYRTPGGVAGGGTAAFPANAYGLTERAVCEMGAMAGFTYYQKVADRIQALINRAYAGSACNWSAAATIGNPNGLMYAMKRQ